MDTKKNLSLGAAIFSVVGLSLVLGFLASRPAAPGFVSIKQPRVSILIERANPQTEVVVSPEVKETPIKPIKTIKTPIKTPKGCVPDPLDPMSCMGELGD